MEEKTRKASETLGKGILNSYPRTRPQTQPNQTHNQEEKQRKKRKTEREREREKKYNKNGEAEDPENTKKRQETNEKGDRTSSGQIVTIILAEPRFFK